MSVAATSRENRAGVVGVGAAMLASVAAVWLISGEQLVAGAYGGGLVALGALGAVIALRRPPDRKVEMASPDWSVTVAAIDRPDMAIAITDRAGRLVCANMRFEEWFGANAPPRLPVDDASLERLNQTIRSAWRDGTSSVEHLQGESKGESVRWRCQVERAGRAGDFLVWRLSLLVASDPLNDLSLQVEGTLGRALSDAGIAAALVDSAGTIHSANTGFALKAEGDPQASMTGRDFVSLLSQDGDRIRWARADNRSGALAIHHVSLADPDEPDAAVRANAPSLMLLADGAAYGASAQSRAAVPHLETLLSHLPLGLAMADRDGRLLFANRAFMRAAGRDAMPPPVYPTDLVVREDKAVLSETVRRYAQGHATAGDITVRLAAQPDDPVSLSLAGVRGLGDAAVLLGLTDSTEETRLKRQIAQATKMQAVGQLAGGVAHDFNNVLTAILGTCDLMLMRHSPGDSDYDDIQQIRANSNRAASLTRQLLAFSRQQTLRPEVLQLPDVVSETTQMLKRLIDERIEFVVSHDRDLGPVRADPSQLGQVIMNLVVNARDAIHARGDGRGRISLSTRQIHREEVAGPRSAIMPDGEYTTLVVEDDGEGIAPENAGKIFEPFFTTKEYGKGTGLGLSTVYGIVKQSDGFIFADSEPGHGTRFTVYLPVYRGPPSTSRAPATAPPSPTAWAGGGNILLVEDEEPVRLVAERALGRQGYTVTAARDGEEGLELVRAGGDYDIVISDVVMPSMDGPAMVREIRRLAPMMPVLFMSGYAEEQLRKEIDLPRVHFLAKPFSVQQISDKVIEVLSSAR